MSRTNKQQQQKHQQQQLEQQHNNNLDVEKVKIFPQIMRKTMLKIPSEITEVHTYTFCKIYKNLYSHTHTYKQTDIKVHYIQMTMSMRLFETKITTTRKSKILI